MSTTEIPSPAGRVERPWGWYESLASGEHYLVKRLLIRRGQRLSLQRHQHRCEHWVVVAGDGQLQVADELIAAAAGTRPCTGPVAAMEIWRSSRCSGASGSAKTTSKGWPTILGGSDLLGRPGDGVGDKV